MPNSIVRVEQFRRLDTEDKETQPQPTHKKTPKKGYVVPVCIYAFKGEAIQQCMSINVNKEKDSTGRDKSVTLVDGCLKVDNDHAHTKLILLPNERRGYWRTNKFKHDSFI